MLIDSLHHADQQLTLLINSLHSPVSDQLMQLFSAKAVWFPLYLLVAFYLVRRIGWKRGLIMIVSIALCILASDQIGNLVKHSVGRLRPCYSTFMIHGHLHILEGGGGLFGFFSAHAANAFGFAIMSSRALKMDKAHGYKTYTFAIFFWATMVSVSRIFVGKHYLGDVVAGAIVGSVIAVVFLKLAEIATGRWPRR